MKFYAERKNMLPDYNKLNYKKLLDYFGQIYGYFYKQGLFNIAFYGLSTRGYDHLPPLMSPSPEIYFYTHLRNDKIYPIDEYYNKYSELDLFTVIEILHEHIGAMEEFGLSYEDFLQKDAQSNFREQINNILRFYKEGYYLSENGLILELPGDGLLELLEQELPPFTPENVIDKINTATRMFFHFDSNMEQKKKAINILADAIEPLRKNLAELLNNEWDLPKNMHDKLIFEIVNSFNIRHNNEKQKTDYSKEIWYDWMFHYYLAVIHTFYKLNNKLEPGL